MIRETLAPATGIADEDVATALGELTGMGRTLIAAGVLADQPLVLAAPPLQLEIRVSLGNDALKGQEQLGKVPGAASASEWGLYVPDPVPYTDQVAEAVARHDALHAGAPPAETTSSTATRGPSVTVDADALRRISAGNRS